MNWAALMFMWYQFTVICWCMLCMFLKLCDSIFHIFTLQVSEWLGIRGLIIFLLSKLSTDYSHASFKHSESLLKTQFHHNAVNHHQIIHKRYPRAHLLRCGKFIVWLMVCCCSFQFSTDTAFLSSLENFFWSKSYKPHIIQIIVA